MKSSIQSRFTGTAVLLFVSGFSIRTATAMDIGPDAFGYTAGDAPFVFEDLSGSGTRVLARTADEVVSAPLGFTFTFYGVDYTSVSWSTNALITFGGTNADAENVSFAAAAPTGDHPSVALLWDDWQFEQPGSDASYYELRGDEGSRRFIIQWNLMFGAPTSPSNVVFEAAFFEGSNDILFSFLDVDTASDQGFGASATVGIRDAAGHTNGRNLEWSFNSPVIMTRQAIRFAAPTDTTPPVIEITSPADGAVVGSDEVLVSATVTDESPSLVSSDPEGVSASLPAGGGMASGAVALVEGTNTIVLSATDAAGNVGGASISIVRDMTAPAVNVTSPADGSIVGDSPVMLVLDVRDATPTMVSTSSTTVLVPSGGGSPTLPVDLTEGVNVIAITAVDAAGNRFSTSVTLMLDLSSPLVTIDSPADGAFFGQGQSPIAVVATVNDASPTRVDSTPSGVSASLPAGGGLAVGAVALVEGPNVITVMASDSTGRNGSGSIVVHLDTTAPMVTLDSPASGMALRGVVELAASAADRSPGSGLDRVELRVDRAVVASLTAEPFSTMLDTTLFAEGRHTLTAMAIDAMGNTALSQASVLFDNTQPVVAFASPAGGAHVSGTMSFSIAARDAQSGLALIQVLAGGRAPTVDPSSAFDPTISSVTLGGEVDTTRFPDGMLALAALAVDGAGNEMLVTVTVDVDNAPPATITILPRDRSVVSGAITISADVSNFGGGMLELFVDGARKASSASSHVEVSFDTTSRPDGSMMIRAVARDNAGNETVATSSVTVDNVAITMGITPTVLSLKLGCWGDHRWWDPRLVVAHLEGAGLESLTPVKRHHVELRVRGGSPVRAIGSWQTHRCRTRRGETPERLHVAFEQRSLVSSIRAGIAAGEIDPHGEVEVALYADGARVASAFIRVVSR